jgi:hypothetical protein
MKFLNFDGYAREEANIQVAACMQSILKGSLKVPGFDNLNKVDIFPNYTFSLL